MHADQIVHALGGRHGIVKCVAHDDSNPSLAIKQAGDGRVLVHCHAGCAQSDVIAALKARGLWEPDLSLKSSKIVSDRSKPIDPIAAIFDYTDERGELLYQIVRRQPTDGSRKYFQQRYPDERPGGWTWKKHPRQVLYHLPEVLESPIVFVVEGEKDVETLRAHGFTATTAAGGCKAAWLPSFTQTLRGREIILIPDADEPGRRRVLEIARALLGHASQIIVFEPESGAKDVTEYFEQGHGELEFIAGVYGERMAL